MRFMVIVKANKETESGVMPKHQELADMEKFNEELVEAHVMLAGEGLHPSSEGKRVRFDGKNRTVTNGPFPQAKELVAGFWLWKCNSMDEAVEWIKKAPFSSGSEVEIRQLYEVEEFGSADPEGKIAERERRLREEIAHQLAPRQMEH